MQKKHLRYIFLIIILLFSSCSHVQYKWPHESSDLKPDPDVVFKTLPNGFKYIFMQNKTPKDRVSMHLNIQAGSINETDKEQGAAHFLEHMLFNGSKHFKPGELVKYFQSIGMEFGPDANAHTGFYSTGYDILLPKGDKKSLAKGMLVMQDYAQSALLLPSEVEKEKKVILAEKRSRDSASYRTFLSSLKFELPDTIISQRLPIGQEHTIKNTDSALLKNFYDIWYRPKKMCLILVGDFDFDEAQELIIEKFAKLSPRALAKPEPDIGQINHQGIKTFYHHEKEAGNTEITIQVLEKIEPEPDSFEFQKKYLIKDIAGQIIQNRLETLIRKPDTPFTSASAGSGIYLKYVKYGFISAQSDPEKWKQSLSVLEQTLRQALIYGFTDDELKRVKSDYLASLDKAVKNADTRESMALAHKIMSSINKNRVFQSPAQEKAIYEPVIKSISLKQVHEAFKQTWNPKHRLIFVTGNADLKNKKDTPDKTILRAFNQSTSKPVSKPKILAHVNFPYLPKPNQTGKIISQKNINDLGITQVDFENGLRLNLKKTNLKANQVIASLCFGFGTSTQPPNKPGLAQLSNAIMNESGLGTLTRDELERALAGKNTIVRFITEQNYFSFQGKSVSKELELLIQLLYANLVDPGFRNNAYLLAMERFEQTYKKLLRTVTGAMPLFGQNFLAGGDTQFGMPSYEQLKKLKLEDVRNWLHKPLTKAPLELSIVGDFDTDMALKLASKYFGTLERNKNSQQSVKYGNPKFPYGKTLNINVDTKIPKGEVRVTYGTDDIWNITQTRRMSVLASIFSDRLREVVREKLGATYSPYAFNAPSRSYSGYGVFQAVVSINPNDTDTVVNAIKDISADIVKNGVNTDELKRSIAPTLTSIKDMRQKNEYWLNTVLICSKRHPEQIEWSRTIEKDYSQITKEEIDKLAKKYLDNLKAGVIKIQPLSK